MGVKPLTLALLLKTHSHWTAQPHSSIDMCHLMKYASLISLLMGRPRTIGWGGARCSIDLWSSLPGPWTAFPLSNKDDKFLLFWISETVGNGSPFLPGKNTNRICFGMKVLISFSDFQTWNMGSNRNCALVSWGSGGYFYNANYYFMTVIYFMLSAVYTPKLAIVLGTELVGLSCCFSKTNLTILWA